MEDFKFGDLVIINKGDESSNSSRIYIFIRREYDADGSLRNDHICTLYRIPDSIVIDSAYDCHFKEKIDVCKIRKSTSVKYFDVKDLDLVSVANVDYHNARLLNNISHHTLLTTHLLREYGKEE